MPVLRKLCSAALAALLLFSMRRVDYSDPPIVRSSVGTPAQLHADRDAIMHSAWWQDETGIMTWSTLQQPEDRAYLAFATEIGSHVADRGVFCGHYGKAPQILPAVEETAFYKEHGLRVTSFLSVEGWDPSAEGGARLLDVLKTHIDRGCDGVHLDMLFQPAREQGAPEMVRHMRDELHRYGQTKYGRDVLFAGNAWQLDSPVALRIGALTDVTWVESWGKSDLDLVRIARVGRSLGGYRTPVWYHLQPDTDAQARIQRLTNLPKALSASCLFEGAEFLCNYKYAVPMTVRATGPGHDLSDWRNYYINAGWRRSLREYAIFAHRYHDYFADALPQSRVLVVFRPEEVQRANDIMNTLLARGLDFNVLPYGDDSLRPITAGAMPGYETIVTPASHPELQSLAHGARVVQCINDLLRLPSDAKYSCVRVEGAANVLTRLFVQRGRRIVHLKQTGYTDSVDGISRTGPLRVTVRAPGVSRGFCCSPEQPSRSPLVLKHHGDDVTFTLTGMTYFSLIVLE